MRESTKGTLSKKNPYYIPKYRYYELKYHCLQYDEWVKKLKDISLVKSTQFNNDRVDGGEEIDITSLLAFERRKLKDKIDEIDRAICKAVPLDLREPIKYAVTKGAGWSVVQARYSLICTRDEYYTTYHKFFWTLDQLA